MNDDRTKVPHGAAEARDPSTGKTKDVDAGDTPSSVRPKERCDSNQKVQSNDSHKHASYNSPPRETTGQPPPHHHHNNNNNNNNNMKKRGMKARSKRNRKRPRSERHALQENYEYQMHVHRLELDGQPILSSSSSRSSTADSTTTWIRTVEPYPYTFSTFAKARWLGRTILDVYSTEFGSYPSSYYESAILQGRILVLDQEVSLDYLVKGGDVLTHTVHRHEPGVAVSSDQPPYLTIVQSTEEVVVVDKPGTLPVHACGGYHLQSLMNLLEPQMGKLYTIHRLDRLTSGLIILGKTSAVAQEWGKAIMDRQCDKVYLARVTGKFPNNCPKNLDRISESSLLPEHGEWKASNATESQGDSVVDARKRNVCGYWITNANGELPVDAKLQDVFESQHDEDNLLGDNDISSEKEQLWIHLACPTRIAKPKDGVCEASAFDDLDDDVYQKTVKPAETSFGVVRYDEATDSTVVLCRPQTGRTHQIRLHLQYLGHPIANDPNYGGDIWYGNSKGQEACRIAQERLDAINASNQENPPESKPGSSAKGPSTATIDVPATEDEIQQRVSASVREDTESIHDYIQRTCVWCARSRNTTGGTPRDMLEFLVRSPGIWLHAFQYSFHTANRGPPRSFRTTLPGWAKVDVA